MRKLLSIITTLSLIAGCSEVPTDDVPPPESRDDKLYASDLEEGGCEMTILPIDSDDPALGFSADDLLDYAEGVFSTDMIWLDDESSVAVDLSITYNGGLIELLDNEPAPTSSGDPIVHCTDSIAIEVDINFVTGDDAFNEALTVHLTTDSMSRVSFYQVLEHSNLGGTFQFDQVDPNAYDKFTMSLFGNIAQDGSTRGSVGASGEVEFNGVQLVDGIAISAWPAADYL
jgi:hypothetical protein